MRRSKYTEGEITRMVMYYQELQGIEELAYEMNGGTDG